PGSRARATGRQDARKPPRVRALAAPAHVDPSLAPAAESAQTVGQKSEGAAGGCGSKRGGALIADRGAGEVVLGKQEDRLRGPLDDAEKVRHARGLLQLLPEEPPEQLL